MSKPCADGCGKQVSDNKRRCLDCMAIDGQKRLAARGVILTHEEVKLGIRSGGAKQSAEPNRAWK